MAEIHPVAYALDETEDRGVRLAYRYLPAPDKPDSSEYDGSYADPHAHVENRLCYGWAHGMGEILTALAGAGLRLESLREEPYCVAPFFDWMERDEQRWYWLPDGEGGRRADLPFSYSVRARKPAGGILPDATEGEEERPMLDDYLKTNLAWWDEAVDVHQGTAMYDLDGVPPRRRLAHPDRA